MKIMIVPGRFGMGHYSAAEALREELLLETPCPDVEVVDAVEALFPAFRGIVYHCFNFLVSRLPGLFNHLSRLADKKQIRMFEGLLTRLIDRFLKSREPDVIIVVLPGCSHYLAACRRATGRSFLLFTLLTDVTLHGSWIENGIDRYFVPATATKEALVRRGVPEQRITVRGIPVRQSFLSLPERALSRKAGAPKHILFMGGGLGLLPSSDKLLRRLIDTPNLELTLIAGRNKALYNKINRHFPQIHVVGFTNQVACYMSKADLLITKPGGITMFEAIHSQTPLYVNKPFLIQEAGNAAWIEAMHIGVVHWDDGRDPAQDILDLLENDVQLAEMKYNMQAMSEQLRRVPSLISYAVEKPEETLSMEQ